MKENVIKKKNMNLHLKKYSKLNDDSSTNADRSDKAARIFNEEITRYYNEALENRRELKKRSEKHSVLIRNVEFSIKMNLLTFGISKKEQKALMTIGVV
uniref:Mobilization protein n=1 Tax=Strongyloides papillosus TaxID=174720 RepID=A0A0N5CFS0_STREA